MERTLPSLPQTVWERGRERKNSHSVQLRHSLKRKHFSFHNTFSSHLLVSFSSISLHLSISSSSTSLIIFCYLSLSLSLCLSFTLSPPLKWLVARTFHVLQLLHLFLHHHFLPPFLSPSSSICQYLKQSFIFLSLWFVVTTKHDLKQGFSLLFLLP